jgi:shikimate dehydrogenase
MTEPPDAPTARTRVAAVIGDPIRHSRSPQILNAAFATMALDWVYVAFEVADGDAGLALDAMRGLGLAGLSVTMPHKTPVADLLAAGRAGGSLSEGAERLRAVNCVAWDGDGLVGHNTDGPGFVASLRADAAFEPRDRRCAVLGAGGAARAIVLALADAGASEVVVVNRTPDRAGPAAALAGPAGRIGAFDDVPTAELVVNATSVGMDGRSTPLDPELLHDGQLVADIVVEPLDTPLLQAARRRGAQALGGLGMLAHQAAVAFEHWTGRPAPVEAMVRAASQQ